MLDADIRQANHSAGAGIDRAFYRSFLRLTATIALQNLILFGVNLCDNIMLGGFSELAMSGAAVAIQYQFLLLQTVAGVGTGAAVIASQHWGKHETAPIRRIFSAALWLGLGIGCVMGALGYFFPERLLRLLTNETLVIEQGAVYLRTLAPTYPVFALTSVGIAMFRSVESPQVGFYLSLAALGLDAVLNYILIFGKLGFPALGVRGAAIATAISYLVQFGLLLLFLRFWDKKLHVRLGDLFRATRRDWAVFTRTALPLVGSALSWGLAMNVQSAILGRMGATSIAANSIATTLFQVISVITYASAGAANVIIGKAVGAGDIPRVKRYTKRLQLLFLAIGAASGLLLFLARGAILSVYRVSPETQALARQFLLVLCVTVVGTSYQMATLTGIVSGGGSTHFVLCNDLIFMWGIVLPLSALSAFVWHFSPLVTFVVLKSDQITKCAVAAVKVNRFRWIRDLTKRGVPEPQERS
ncbi:MAG: MATE family efflux transporter [Oscillospiraceae bacterium]|jgi:putative MATE family efflux protein|nr:MATE family efflux transporter [Oscillospiraceae bacterium]